MKLSAAPGEALPLLRELLADLPRVHLHPQVRQLALSARAGGEEPRVRLTRILERDTLILTCSQELARAAGQQLYRPLPTSALVGRVC